MALSPAEKQKRYRDRQREAAKTDEDVTLPYCGTGFAEFAGTVPFSFDETLDSLGVRLDGTWLDVEEQHFRSDGLGDVTMTSIERATRLAGAFIDAAYELSLVISTFKKDRLTTTSEEILASAKASTEGLESKLAEIARLHEMCRALGKQVRRDFAKTEVKRGEVGP